ncbi:ABC transporter ATP-binding protein/permease [Paucibacter sp. R3-3]|uniref:ABC transporter ATP-binding protein/permease n=1 Tax=Roseateles agri TaxID=3098619 RepID=A0ABU5DF54_9BURK|nr:ABC transporter ATP-binding protein/permease [Paucibacter sp. R3-3]MDY0744375.1 ABC transporter ATP-binding protein/permease [Paucibacter sp. R3-3]
MAAWRQFIQVAKPYWLGDQRRSAWTLLAVLVVLMLAQTQLAVVLNNQAGEMTSALAAREAPRFWRAVRLCLVIVAIVVPVTAGYYYMRDLFSNQWRRWLTGRFLDGYLADRRYYELGASGELDNPDQRISEDINNFTGRSINFLLIFLGSAMQLVAFSAVLWSISRTLVAFLAVYSVVGTVVALWVFGQPLIKLNFWQIRREADFRFGLMRLRENAEAIAFYRGEAQERAQLDRQFQSVYANYGTLIKKQRSLNLFQTAFSQLTLVVPSIILADGVLSGALEVGRAVQAAGAFAAVLSAVAVIVDNFESLSRFVAGIGRLDTLAKQVLAGPPGTEAEKIEARVGPHVALEAVTLRTPQFDRLLISELNLELPPGEGLLITGVSGCGKSSLLRAIAGLWRRGSGTVQHPEMTGVLFLPQQPYMQHGSLRSQMLYPSTERPVDDARLLQILDEVQLGGLAERVGGLDAVQDWEKLLSVGERQRLAFARVVVHEPELVILDEATSALDAANEARLYADLRSKGCTVISIAHRPALLRYHTRVLELKGEGAWALHEAQAFRFED